MKLNVSGSVVRVGSWSCGPGATPKQTIATYGWRCLAQAATECGIADEEASELARNVAAVLLLDPDANPEAVAREGIWHRRMQTRAGIGKLELTDEKGEELVSRMADAWRRARL